MHFEWSGAEQRKCIAILSRVCKWRDNKPKFQRFLHYTVSNAIKFRARVQARVSECLCERASENKMKQRRSEIKKEKVITRVIFVVDMSTFTASSPKLYRECRFV